MPANKVRAFPKYEAYYKNLPFTTSILGCKDVMFVEWVLLGEGHLRA
jgi:hypothetical protein